MVMKAWRPSMWIPLIMVAWGVVMIGMGFVKNFAGLLVARIILGITEAGGWQADWVNNRPLSWHCVLPDSVVPPV